MKNILLLVLALGTALAVFGALGLPAEARTPSKEKAVVEFTDKTRLLGAVLQGKYLVVHDSDRMANGEACIYVYKFSEGESTDSIDGDQSRLVVSFHCTRVERKPVNEVVLTFAMSSDGTTVELKEIQLPGSTEGHRVPNR